MSPQNKTGGKKKKKKGRLSKKRGEENRRLDQIKSSEFGQISAMSLGRQLDISDFYKNKEGGEMSGTQVAKKAPRGLLYTEGKDLILL